MGHNTSTETETDKKNHKADIISRLKLKTTNWNWQSLNWKSTKTWMQCMILNNQHTQSTWGSFLVWNEFSISWISWTWASNALNLSLQ